MANEKRLIDANAFIKEHCEDCKYFNVDGICTKEDPVCGSVMIVTELPTVDAVEVVHGRWLYDSGTERHFCSACNEYAISVISNEPVYEYDWEENLQFSHIESACDEQLTNYCPNCGAKMDGDGNGYTKD